MSAFNFSLDDSSGESLGSGLDSGALDLSSSDSLGEQDDLSVLGSSLTLGDSSLADSEPLSVTDPLSAIDDLTLSGISDPIQLSALDTGNMDTNGAGSAASSHPLTAQPTDNYSSVFAGISKFGSSLGQLFARGATSAQGVAVAHPPANLNPNRSVVSTVSSSHAALLIGIVVVIGAAIALGGKHV